MAIENDVVHSLDFNDVIDVFAKSKARKAVFWTVDLCLHLISILDKFYTVGHKKRDTFIFVITLANIDRFS